MLFTNNKRLKGASLATPGTLIMAFVAIVIGASLVGPLADIVSLPGGNVTGAALAIYGLLTLFFVIVVIMVAVKAIGK